MINANVYGVARLEAILDKAVDIHALEQGVRKACSLVQGAAKLRAHVNTGELRETILMDVSTKGNTVHGKVYTNAPQGVYQEFGTGPKGEANHAGISPDVTPSYTQSPWWVHESQVDPADAERYHWFSLQTEKGKFYQISGQPADPFMYPALKNNQEEVADIISKSIREAIKEAGR